MEAPEKSVAWILVVSIIMFFVSMFLWYTGSIFYYGYYSMTHDVWFYMAIVAELLFILTLMTSALCLAHFEKRAMYYATVTLFSVSMILVFFEALRPLF